MALVPNVLQTALLAIYDQVEIMAKTPGVTAQECKLYQATQTAIAIDTYIRTGTVNPATWTIS
jgi:hypothetical protein